MGLVCWQSRAIGPVLVATVALLVTPLGFGESEDEPKSKPKEAASKKLEAAKPARTPEEEAKDEATKAADKYLVLLDKGKFGESWDSMTDELQKGIPRRKWMAVLSKTRTPFGKLKERQVNRVEMKATEVVDKFDEAWVYTDIRPVEGAASSELVIVVLEKGKGWTVNSYYVGDPQAFPKPPVLDEAEKPKPAKK